MPDGFVSILLIFLVIAIVWLVIKAIFKLTMQIFSCGCLLLVVIGGLIFFASYFGLS